MSNHLIHFFPVLRNRPMLVALLLGLTALLGVAPPATAQTSPSLSSLELVAISKVDPPNPSLLRKSHIPDSVNFSPSELSKQTTPQSVTITSPNWSVLHYFCRNKNVSFLRPQDDVSSCRLLKEEDLPLVTLKSKEIKNGGVVWHMLEDGGGSSVVAKWIPIPTLSPVKLNQAFSASQTTYTGKIPSTAKSLQIIPTASSGTIRVRVNNDSDTIVASGDTLVVSSLDAGDNIVTVSVRAGGTTTNYTVRLSRNAVPSFGNGTVTEKFFTSGYAIAPFQVPEARGGDSTLVYSAEDLPAGLTFDADGSGACRTARQICGTPTGRDTTVTIYAADLDNNTSTSDRASLKFSINIVGVSISETNPTSLTDANLDTAKITLRLQNAKFVLVDTSHFELVTRIPNVSISQLSENPGNSDRAVLSLSFSGGVFNTDQTLAVRVKANGIQYADGTQYNTNRDLTTDPRTVTHYEDQTPTFGTATKRDTTYTVKSTVSDTLPGATGGNGTLTYALTSDLPAGLTYKVATSGNGGVIAGKPTTAASASTYTLTVTDADANTAASDTDTLTFTLAVRNATPTNVRVTALVDTLEVRWTAVTNAEGYKVQWKSGSETIRQATTTDTTYKIGLTAGTTYTVQVIATSTQAADSYPSGGVTGVPKFARPGKPTNVQVKPGVTAITVSWDTVTTADGYKVRWKSGSGSDTTYSTSRQDTTRDTTYKIRNLTAGTTYTVQVIATRRQADDSDSVEVTGMPASLDIDGNGRVELLSDYILILRYVLDLRREALTDRAVSLDATRTPQDIERYLAILVDQKILDVDGNGRVELLSDVILILRYVLDLRREALTDRAVSLDATRTTHQDITSYICSLHPNCPSSSKAAISMDSAETAHILSALAADGDLTSLLFALGVLLPTADFDGDGQVTFADFLTFAGKFGTRRGEERYDARCDLNGDGEIGFADFLIFADNFGSAN